MNETPNTVHGRLLEAAHISGYTAKRAVTEMEWLLEEDRWREVGPGYEHVDDFLASIDLSEFKIAMEQRRSLVKKLTELQAAERATARAIGVSHQTINNDVKKLTPAPFQIPAAKVAEAVEKQAKRKEREAALGGRSEKREKQARTEAKEHAPPCKLFTKDIHDWRPKGVQAIVTDPEYIGDSIPLYEALRDFAVDVLPEGGALAVMTWQAILPGVVRALEHPDLAYRWCLSWRYAQADNATVDHAHRVFDRWKPILLYHKGAMPENATMTSDEITSEYPDKSHHEWGQSLEGFQHLVRAVAEPGELVCDPFVGGGTTALAALSQGRPFVGADIDPEAIKITKGRLA